MCLRDDAEAHAVLSEVAKRGWSDNQTRIEAKRRLHAYYLTHSSDVVSSLADLLARGQRFNTILADPPWTYGTSPGLKGGSEVHYRSLPFDELAVLPVDQVSSDRTTLFLWTPRTSLKQAFRLMEQWGFDDSDSEIIWHKRPGFGIGFYARMVHEHLCIGVRPQSPTWDGTIPSVIEAPRSRRHSEKPDVFIDIIERATLGPRLALLGRKDRLRWTVVGDQISDAANSAQPLVG